MNQRPGRDAAAFTLADLLIAMMLVSMVLAGTITAQFALTRSVALSDQASLGNNDAARVADYIAKDLRSALSASVSGNILTITVPDYFSSPGVPRTPSLSYGTVQYTTTPLTIRYLKQGYTIVREESGVAKVIANWIRGFTVTDQQPATTAGTIVVAPRSQTTASVPWVAITVSKDGHFFKTTQP